MDQISRAGLYQGTGCELSKDAWGRRPKLEKWLTVVFFTVTVHPGHPYSYIDVQRLIRKPLKIIPNGGKKFSGRLGLPLGMLKLG